MRRARAKSRGEDRDLLHLVGQRSNNVEIGNRREFTDLLDGHIRLAIGAGLGRIAIISFELWLQLVGKSEPYEFAGDVQPADTLARAGD